MTNTSSRNTNWIILVISIFLFLYVVYRAKVLSFTWDEAFSYLQFVRYGVLIPDKYEQMDANNHLLNTWLNIHLVKYLGVSELILRIPSLIAHILFLLYSYKLVNGFQNRWLVISSFLIINLNPYQLDFFSLSRGYALSLGLMMTSIYYLHAYFFKEYKTKYAIFSCFAGALATAANFVMLNYFIVSFGLILMIESFNAFQSKKNIREKIVQFIKAIAFPSIIVFFSLWLLLPIAFKLKEAGALFYGGEIGFWQDTICTIIDRCFYELNYHHLFQIVARGLVILIIFGGTCFFTFRSLRSQLTSNTLFFGALILLILLCSLSTIIQHYIFGTQYLMERTALCFIVLFNLIFIFFINELAKENKKATIVCYLASCFAVFHFACSFNLHYVLEWKSNADVKQMISDLEKVKEIPKEKNNINICIPLSFDQSINYYRAVDNLTWINPVDRSAKANLLFDYLYLEPSKSKRTNMDSIEIIKIYPVTNNFLAKPKYPPNLTKVCFLQELNFDRTTEDKYVIDEKVEYGQGFNYTIDDSITPGRNAEVVFNGKISAPDVSQCNLGIIISFENKSGVYVWKRAYIKDWIQNENKWVDVSYTCIVPSEAKEGDELKSYIWNPNKHKLFVKKLEFKWLSKE